MSIIEIKNITKKYGENVVLNNVSFSLNKGEIHALLGENGAGKSTLMNILSGMPVIEKTGGFFGEIFIEGEKVVINNPKDAVKYGISITKQELSIIDDITVWENMFLNDEMVHKNSKTLDINSMRDKTNTIIKNMKCKFKADDICKNLSVGEKHFVEIGREIKKDNIKVIIFDEPTASLTNDESKIFGDIIRDLSKKGISIIFITHRLDEVMEYADRITVLRYGKNVGTFNKNEVTENELAKLMVGQEVNPVENYKNKTSNNIALSIKNLSAKNGNEFIKNLCLDVYKGEIIGIGGMTGQGRNIIGDVLGGIINSTGDIFVNGVKVKNGDSENILKNGIAYVSSDRKGTGLYLAGSIYENICLSAMYINGKFIKKIGFIKFNDRKSMREYSKKCVDKFNIKCENINQPVGELSGGNQQKVCIAKALALNPKILVVSDVTRGVDIGAKNNIIDSLKYICDKEGLTIIMISSDLKELRSVCGRIAIINNGNISEIINSDEPSERFGIAMSYGGEKN